MQSRHKTLITTGLIIYLVLIPSGEGKLSTRKEDAGVVPLALDWHNWHRSQVPDTLGPSNTDMTWKLMYE